MSKILAYTIQAPGHISPFIPILRELKSRGHAVMFALFSATKQPNIAGIHVRRLRWNTGVPGEPYGTPCLATPENSDAFECYGEQLASTLERVIIEENPDLLLLDPVLWGGMVASEASGLPWVSLAHNPKLFRGLGVDVRGPGLSPPRGALGLVWYRAIETVLRAGADARNLRVMNAVRLGRGLVPLTHVWDRFYRPPLTIATTAEPFEYPRTDWPLSIRFVGPLSWEPTARLSSWIHDLDDRPLILLVGSSVPERGKARSWVGVALDTLAEEPFQVIATLPTDETRRPVPPNVRMERFVPHGQLLSRTACVICHGGHGITQKALAAGVPVVAIPFAHDRFEVARRVEVAGAGVMLPGSRLTPARLKVAIYDALGCKAGAERIAESFRRAGGAEAAAHEIEGLLEAEAYHP